MFVCAICRAYSRIFLWPRIQLCSTLFVFTLCAEMVDSGSVAASRALNFPGFAPRLFYSSVRHDDEARVSVVPPVVASFFRLLAGG